MQIVPQLQKRDSKGVSDGVPEKHKVLVLQISDCTFPLGRPIGCRQFAVVSGCGHSISVCSAGEDDERSAFAALRPSPLLQLMHHSFFRWCQWFGWLPCG